MPADRFTIRWDGYHGYRVSIPGLDNAEVVMADDFDRLTSQLAGAVEDRDHYRNVLSGLLIYARGNQHLLDKIHTALDSPPSRGQ